MIFLKFKLLLNERMKGKYNLIYGANKDLKILQRINLNLLSTLSLIFVTYFIICT